MLDLRPARLSKSVQTVLLESPEWGDTPLTSAIESDLHCWLERSIGLATSERVGDGFGRDRHAEIIEELLIWVVDAIGKSVSRNADDVDAFLRDYLTERSYSVGDLIEQLKLLGAADAAVESATVGQLA